MTRTEAAGQGSSGRKKIVGHTPYGGRMTRAGISKERQWKLRPVSACNLLNEKNRDPADLRSTQSWKEYEN